MLTTWTVNTPFDVVNPSDNLLSLREAIQVEAISGDTIDFEASLSGATITLELGEIAFSKSLTIDASMLTNGITIDGNDPTPVGEPGHQSGDGIRIFNITDLTSGSDPPLVTLEGLTLKGGDPDRSASNQFGNGGAIFSEARLEIFDCTIEQNDAFSGGGIHISVAGGSPTTQREVLTIEDSLFRNNEARSGGAIDIDSSDTTDPTSDLFSITRTTISNNHALSQDPEFGGGGVYALLYGAHLTVTESTISGNTAAALSVFLDFAGGGGGLYVRLHESASLTVDKTVVSDNHATLGIGGGILAKAYGNVSNPYPDPRAITITGSTISDNTADDRGGGLFLFNREGTEALVQESRVTGNQVPSNATGNYLNGGGIYALFWNGHDPYPDVDADLKPKFTITRSTVDNNFTPEKGGGIFVNSKYNGDFIATNSTISGNSTTESSGAGGGMYIARYQGNHSVDAYLRNVTVTQNTSADGGGVGTADLDNVRVRIANSIISENVDHQSAPNNLDGRVIVGDFKHNLVGTGSTILDHVTGQIVYRDDPFVNTIPTANNNIMGTAANSPHLGALQNNGGLTPTHRLELGSPAIDRGSNDYAKHPLTNVAFTTDQRGAGFPRIFDHPGVSGSGAETVDIGAHEAELCVSTPNDELDTELNLEDLSLREAVDYANAAGVPTVICLPAGVYNLTLSGIGGVSQGDLDITGLVSIVGDGPGFTIIDASALGDRHFDIAGGATLGLSQLTLAYGAAPTAGVERNGGAIRVQNGGHLDLSFSAIVGNMSQRSGDGGGIYFAATGSGSIENSVITVNESEDNTGGVYLAPSSGTGGMVSVKNSIIAKNIDDGSSSPDVFAGTNRTFSSGGNNRLGNWANGFGATGDMVGTPHYIVTTIADTYDGASDAASMSLRDAIHRANITAGAEEIWLPAWEFVLTRDRDAYGGGSATDVDVSFGDLDIKDTLTILGTGPEGTTTVRWKPGIIDALFDLLGDYNGDAEADYNKVSSADYTIWEDMEGQQGENLAADGNDDGQVDQADHGIITTYFGNTLTLDNVDEIT